MSEGKSYTFKETETGETTSVISTTWQGAYRSAISTIYEERPKEVHLSLEKVEVQENGEWVELREEEE